MAGVTMLAALVVAWGALSFGAVYPWAYWPLVGGCLVCGVAGWFAGRETGLPSALLLVALFTVPAAALLQLIPVPRDVLAIASPVALTVLPSLDVAFAVGADAWHPLSIAPTSTGRALALYAGFAVMLIGLVRAPSASAPRRLVEAIVVLGVLLAVIGIVQKPLYAGKIYGFWEPLMRGSAFGPFVNKNHFAGWMLMALPLCLGLLCAGIHRGMRGVKPTWRDRVLWFSSPEANRIILVATAALVMSLSLVLTMSRSGMVAFGAAVAITAWKACRRVPAKSGQLVAAAYFACLVLGIVTWIGADTIAMRFAAADTTSVNNRMPIWEDTVPMVREFWLTGSGLNTYGSATLFYQRSQPNVHLREAHNDYLQLAAEGGLLVGIPVLVLLVVFWREVRRRFLSSEGSGYWIRLGAVTGLIAIAIQSTVEFSLQMPANAALFTVLCAIALHDGRARTAISNPGISTKGSTIQ